MRAFTRFVSFLALGLLSTAQIASAQSRANTILVLDGSGSMWGQIDGVNKIVIAREVVASIIADFPADQNLGLTVYGHRTRGDCTDIETVVTPGIDNRTAILDAVNAINPRGKTPMTDSVIAAAEALRFTEEAATVILVSDGIETCNPDPCAAGVALEQAGIDFTAHVVGFDVTEADALAQMQCLAETTGGQFLTASNADELAAALTQVVAAPEIVIVPGTFTAVLDDTARTPIDEPILWTITSATGTLVEDMSGNPLTLDLVPGDYTASAYRIVDEMALDMAFSVAGDAAVAVDIAFPVPLPQASVLAPDTAVAGSTVQVDWEGPANQGDYIAVARPGEGSINHARVGSGNPAQLLMPTEPGVYEVRYQLFTGNDILASRSITVTEVSATLEAPATATAGQTLSVGWTGPDYENDYISIGRPGERYTSYVRTRFGSPAELLLPTEPGDYELRYQLQQDGVILATRAITLTDVGASLTAPDTAIAGQMLTVGWDGPDYDRDYISVGLRGEGYINYVRTNTGNPVELQMPTEPGDYELRYQLQQGGDILAARPITLTEVGASLTAPDTAIAGQMLTIGWDGPDYDRDYISVGLRGEGYINYVRTNTGNPVELQMPTEPGDYELRYQLQQGGDILAARPITLTDVGASLTAAETALIGEPVSIGWEGPDYDRDYISVGLPGEGYINYVRTNTGNPVSLPMPTLPGTYELRYQLQQGGDIIASRTITVGDIKVTLTAPAEAPAGSTILIAHDGPDYDRDYVSVALPGGDYINYARTGTGNPTALVLPTEPGTYNLLYQMQQGGVILGAVPITVTPLDVQLVAPPSVALSAGTITVGWDGPDYDRDYISFGVPGEEAYITYARTNTGNPLSLALPDAPGDYEVRYQLQQGGVIMARVPVTVTAD